MRSVFISSTFRDMQAERDALSQYVLPDVAAEAARHHEDIDFIDLRWGVDTSELESEDGARKVLSVCLDEIEHSRPYMIILLGERYGWVPDRALMNSVALEKDYTVDEEFKSVTALEIEFGALADGRQIDRCLFYRREGLEDVSMTDDDAGVYKSESPRHRKKLDTLIEKIEKQIGKHIPTYRVGWDEKAHAVTGLETFCEMVTADLKALLQTEWMASEKLSEYERSILSSWQFFEKKAEECTALDSLIDEYEANITCDTTSFFLLKGASGCGKSTIIGRIAVNLRNHGDDVFPFVCGSSESTGSTDDLMRQLIAYLTKLTGESNKNEYKEEQFDENRIRLTELVNKYALRFPQKKLYIVIDAMEFLSGTGVARFDWAPDILPDNVRIISCFTNDKNFDAPIRSKDRAVVCERESLTRIEAVNILRAIFKRAHKEINDDIIRKILSLQSVSSPLFLSLLAHRLIMLNSADFGEIEKLGNDMYAINQYLLKKVEETPDDIGELCRLVLSDAGAVIDRGMAFMVIRLIASAPSGLRERDIAEILKRENRPYDALSFARLIKYMRPFFIYGTDGRIDFSHQIIRRAVDDTENIKTRLPFYRHIWSYLTTLSASDPICADYRVYFTTYIGEWQDAVSFVAGLDKKKDKRAFNASMARLRDLTVTKHAGTLKTVSGFFERLRDYNDYEGFVLNVAQNIYSFYSLSTYAEERKQNLYATLIPYLDELFFTKEMIDAVTFVEVLLKQVKSYFNTGKYPQAGIQLNKCLTLLAWENQDDKMHREIKATVHRFLGEYFNNNINNKSDLREGEEHCLEALRLSDDPFNQINATMVLMNNYYLKQVVKDFTSRTSIKKLTNAKRCVENCEYYDNKNHSTQSKGFLSRAYSILGESYLDVAWWDNRMDEETLTAAYDAYKKSLCLDEETVIVIRSYDAYLDLAMAYVNVAETLVFRAIACDESRSEAFLAEAKSYFDKAKPLLERVDKAAGSVRSKKNTVAYLSKLYAWYAVQGDRATEDKIYDQILKIYNEMYRQTGDQRYKKAQCFAAMGIRIPKRKKKKRLFGRK